MKKLQILAFSLGMLLVGCDKTEVNQIEQSGHYIVVATPDGSISEGADYILQASTLEGDTITNKNAGIEQDGYRYYAFTNNKVFSLLYGQGNPGDVRIYQLDENQKLYNSGTINTPTVQAFGLYNNELIEIKSPRSITTPQATIMRLDTENPRIIYKDSVNTTQLMNNGEMAHFTGVFKVGNDIWAPFMSIKGVPQKSFHTDYTDSTWIAVFSYPDLKLKKVIKDNRTSYIGYYFAQSCLDVTENGDVYCFSQAVTGGTGIVPSTKPSAAVRVKAGTDEFDKSYFFNIQEKSGGHHIYSARYLGNNKFCLIMYAEKNFAESLYGVAPYRFAIVDVVKQTFQWVSGMPEPEQLTAIARLPYVDKQNNTIAWGIMTKTDVPYVYIIDGNTATAKKGLRVEAGGITAVGRLN